MSHGQTVSVVSFLLPLRLIPVETVSDGRIPNSAFLSFSRCRNFILLVGSTFMFTKQSRVFCPTHPYLGFVYDLFQIHDSTGGLIINSI